MAVYIAQTISSLTRDFYKIQDPLYRRIAIFKYVRDIPYSTMDSHSIEDALTHNRANCHAKSILLQTLFMRFHCKTQIIICRYALRDIDPSSTYLPHQYDYHYYTQVWLSKQWVSVDATFDPPLAAIGLPVNEWDGYTSTPIMAPPINSKVLGQRDIEFDTLHARLNREVEVELTARPWEYAAYRVRFNEWLQSAREGPIDNLGAAS